MSRSKKSPPSTAGSPAQSTIEYRGRKKLREVGIVPIGGRLDASELSTIDSIAASSDVSPEQIDALAIALKRNPATIAKYVQAAKDKFNQNASRYADIHMRVAEKALALDDPKALETARKASEFAMQNNSAVDADGKQIRVIDSAQQSSNAPVIKIGIALGGLPAATHVTDATRIDNDE